MPGTVSRWDAYDQLGMVLVVGTKAGVADVERQLQLLDRPRRPLQFELLVVEVAAKVQEQSGLTWTLSQPAGGPGPVTAYATGYFDTQLESWRRNKASKERRLEPQRALEREPATFAWVREETPRLPDGWQATGPLRVQNRVTVTGWLVGQPPNESVTLEVVPDFRQVIGFALTAEGFPAPVVAEGHAAVKLRLPLGGQAMLGCLTQAQGAETLLWIRPGVVRQPPAAK